MKKWLFQPVHYIAGFQALSIGAAAMLVTAVISYFSTMHFDGVLDAHVGTGGTLPVYLAEQIINLLSATTVFYLLGLILSRSSIRFIDVAGTMALARWPMLFVAILGFLHHPFTDISKIPTSELVLGIAMLPFIIWMVALMYHSFTISCNLHKTKAILGFIGGIILSEILSKILVTQLYQHFF